MAKYTIQVEIDIPDDADQVWQGEKGAVRCFMDSVVGPSQRILTQDAETFGNSTLRDDFARKKMVALSASIVSAVRSPATDHPFLIEWGEAYAAFRGAFDTPLARCYIHGVYADDARQRMASIHERLTAGQKAPEKG
jgi:hypothetical protein